MPTMYKCNLRSFIQNFQYIKSFKVIQELLTTTTTHTHTYVVALLWKSVSCLCVAVTTPPLFSVGKAFSVVSSHTQNVWKYPMLCQA